MLQRILRKRRGGLTMAKRFMGINPAHKGYCTPMTKSTCTGARRRLALTLKKHHGFHKAQAGGVVDPSLGEGQAPPSQAVTKRSRLPKRALKKKAM